MGAGSPLSALASATVQSQHVAPPGTPGPLGDLLSTPSPCEEKGVLVTDGESSSSHASGPGKQGHDRELLPALVTFLSFSELQLGHRN